jgi:diphosphomevalonate decarboxylase
MTMQQSSASVNLSTAVAHPNIALIKYWGDADQDLHIPANGSISMTLAELCTQTSVKFDPQLIGDEFILNGKVLDGAALARVKQLLDRVRHMAGMVAFARVKSENNFPSSAGIASSASGFAALSLAASHAAGLSMDERSLTRLARTGSGSACRSISGGFVEWLPGTNDLDSYAVSIAQATHWDLVDCVAIVSQAEKSHSSLMGHALAATSPLQSARLADAPRRLDLCRQAILSRDFVALAEVVELDSNLMHAVMCTSQPPLIYWLPATLAVIQAVQAWRKAGLPACYTIDAGPNVHVICAEPDSESINHKVRDIPGVIKVITARIGGPARMISLK